MSWWEKKKELFSKEQKSLESRFPKLKFETTKGQLALAGPLFFKYVWRGFSLEDCFSIRIVYPKNFPNNWPQVFETGGRIPTSFHTNPDGSLCLGSNLKIHLEFSENPTTIQFINRALTPFLFSFSYFDEYGIAPFGELRHGGRGLVSDYKQILELDDTEEILRTLELIRTRKYRGHMKCVCGSGIRMRQCHGKRLLPLTPIPVERLANDISQILGFHEQRRILPNLKK